MMYSTVVCGTRRFPLELFLEKLSGVYHNLGRGRSIPEIKHIVNELCLLVSCVVVFLLVLVDGR